MDSRSTFTKIGAALFAFCATGCGGNSFTSATDGSAGGGANNGPALSEIPRLYAQAMCTALTACSASAANLFLGANDCVKLVTAQIQNASLPGIQSAVAAGTAKYNPSAVQGCIDAISSGGCISTSNNPYVPACESALQGTVDTGGACAIDEECKDDLYCKYSGACPGTCARRETEEALCRENKDCQPGLTCFVTKGATGTCMGKPTLGEECGFDLPSDCAPQSGDAVVCWGADSTKRGKCVAVNSVASQAVGADCSVLASSLCVSGATCQLASIALNGTCIDASAPSSGCTFSYPDPCAKDQSCTATGPSAPGTCSLLPTEGQPCLTGLIAQFSNKVCAPDHICNGASSGVAGTCVKYRVNGEACTADKVCYSGRCDSQSLQCVPRQNCKPGS